MQIQTTVIATTSPAETLLLWATAGAKQRHLRRGNPNAGKFPFVLGESGCTCQEKCWAVQLQVEWGYTAGLYSRTFMARAGSFGQVRFIMASMVLSSPMTLSQLPFLPQATPAQYNFELYVLQQEAHLISQPVRMNSDVM